MWKYFCLYYLNRLTLRPVNCHVVTHSDGKLQLLECKWQIRRNQGYSWEINGIVNLMNITSKYSKKVENNVSCPRLS